MNSVKRNSVETFDSTSVTFCNQTRIALSGHVDMRHVLFGYFEEFLSPMTPLNHDHALCAVIEDIDCIIVDYGKDIKRFLNLTEALAWAKSILGVKVFRCVDLSLFGEAGFFIEDYMDELRENSDSLIDFFVDSFNHNGWRVSPYQLARDVEIMCEDNEPELVEALYNFARNMHGFSSIGPDRSPWFMSKPDIDGTYKVCFFNGKVESVELKRIHSEGDGASGLMVFRGEGEPVLLSDRKTDEWLWSYTFNQATPIT
ncbi:hypothetical protein [Vibrio hyugaensis]|nr:hypothetical protein [Vibrio hyugaensis]